MLFEALRVRTYDNDPLHRTWQYTAAPNRITPFLSLDLPRLCILYYRLNCRTVIENSRACHVHVEDDPVEADDPPLAPPPLFRLTCPATLDVDAAVELVYDPAAWPFALVVVIALVLDIAAAEENAEAPVPAAVAVSVPAEVVEEAEAEPLASPPP